MWRLCCIFLVQYTHIRQTICSWHPLITSPLPDIPTRVYIDSSYVHWYNWKYGNKLDHNQVLPIHHTLQVHPESESLWEEHINSILYSLEFSFKSTVHDQCIHCTTFEDCSLLLLCQVDNFLISCSSASIPNDILNIIGDKPCLPTNKLILFNNVGLASIDFDLEQTNDPAW